LVKQAAACGLKVLGWVDVAGAWLISRCGENVALRLLVAHLAKREPGLPETLTRRFIGLSKLPTGLRGLGRRCLIVRLLNNRASERVTGIDLGVQGCATDERIA